MVRQPVSCASVAAIEIDQCRKPAALPLIGPAGIKQLADLGRGLALQRIEQVGFLAGIEARLFRQAAEDTDMPQVDMHILDCQQ